jgi:tetratricopeptide (TPR) repeat protein
MDDLDAATASFTAAAAADPTSASAWYYLGTVSYMRSSYKGSLYYYGKALELDPTCITAWYNKGFILNVMGDVSDAVECYDKILAIDPECESALYNKQFALYRIGKSVSAEEAKTKLDAIDPGFAAALDGRGTKFFLPTSYSDTLDYELPTRWYSDIADTTATEDSTSEDGPFLAEYRA